MTTEARSLALDDDDAFELVPARTETIACTTDQWNHPFPPDQPFARALVDLSGEVLSETRATCEQCGIEVDAERIGPNNKNVYYFKAKPHARLRRYYIVSDDELDRLVQIVENEYGSLR